MDSSAAIVGAVVVAYVCGVMQGGAVLLLLQRLLGPLAPRWVRTARA